MKKFIMSLVVVGTLGGWASDAKAVNSWETLRAWCRSTYPAIPVPGRGPNCTTMDPQFAACVGIAAKMLLHGQPFNKTGCIATVAYVCPGLPNAKKCTENFLAWCNAIPF